ncbi:4124_t:CDS:1, partial [Racocetra persica]
KFHYLLRLFSEKNEASVMSWISADVPLQKNGSIDMLEVLKVVVREFDQGNLTVPINYRCIMYTPESRLYVPELRKFLTLISRYPENTIFILMIQDNESLSRLSFHRTLITLKTLL